MDKPLPWLWDPPVHRRASGRGANSVKIILKVVLETASYAMSQGSQAQMRSAARSIEMFLVEVLHQVSGSNLNLFGAGFLEFTRRRRQRTDL